MSEKLKERSFSELRKRQWLCAFAASLMLFAPLGAAASTADTNESTAAIQQQAKRTVTGTVLDENGDPVVGATVTEKGNAKNGAITNIDGKFTLQIASGSKLNVNFLGYVPQDVTVTGGSVVVNLVPNAESLDEVVVVAYGTQKKKDVTGSLSQVNAQDIAIQNTTTVSRALEGAAPGIRISSVDGQPGFDTGIRVRGVSSTSGNSANALIVIDGVPQEAPNGNTENPLAQLNPSDIADVSVLKDAASTALYGSRGANGVILITTKSGQSGKAKINFEGRWGWNLAGSNDWNSMNKASQVYEYAWRSIYNSYRYGVENGRPKLVDGVYTTNVQTPNHTDEEARLFASQHLFDYVGSETNFQKNALGNSMAYIVPGATYTMTGSGNNSSATMGGAYLVDPATGRINPAAKLIYDETMEDLLLDTKFRQEYNITASGGTDKVHYYFSLGYQDDPSYVRSTSYRRYSGRSNMDALVTKWLKVGANVAYSNTKTRGMTGYWGMRNIGATSGNTMNYIDSWSPITSYYQYDENGNVVVDANGNRVLNFGNHRTWSPFGVNHVSDGIPWGRDLLRETDLNSQIQNVTTWSSRLFAEAKFLKYFTFRLNFNFDNRHNRFTRYWNGSVGSRTSTGGSVNIWVQDRQYYDAQELLSYSQDFLKVHHVDALVGHEYEDTDQKVEGVSSGYELLPGYIIPGNFAAFKNTLGGTGYGFPTPGWQLGTYRTEAYFGRVNYNYNERYYFSASLRRDAASKFRHDQRWGTFWSIGGGWRFSEEAFMKSTKNWLDNAKLRLSYGVTGNANGITSWYTNATWSYGVSTWRSTNGNFGTPETFRINAPGSPAQDDITWENVHQFDVGLDFSLLGSRITGSIDYYNNLTSNSLFAQAVSPLANLGQTSRTHNSAKLRNTGIEIELYGDVIRTKDFNFNIGFNGTHYRTTLEKVPASQIPEWREWAADPLPKGTWTANADGWSASGTGNAGNVVYLRGEGKDLYNLYLYKYAGIDQESGLPMYWHRVSKADMTIDPEHNPTYAHEGRYKDYKEGENVKTTNYADASLYEQGSATPDFMGGFTMGFRYKDFDLNVVAAYQIGGKFMSIDYANELYRSDVFAPMDGERNLSKDLIGNTWTPENTGAKFPMQWWTNASGGYYLNGSTIGSWKYTNMALFNASYLRLKNVTLGYTMPKELTSKVGVNKFRVFLSLDNVLKLTTKRGIDPSMSSTGGFEVGARPYPQTETITIGVNLEL